MQIKAENGVEKGDQKIGHKLARTERQTSMDRVLTDEEKHKLTHDIADWSVQNTHISQCFLLKDTEMVDMDLKKDTLMWLTFLRYKSDNSSKALQKALGEDIDTTLKKLSTGEVRRDYVQKIRVTIGKMLPPTVHL